MPKSIGIGWVEEGGERNFDSLDFSRHYAVSVRIEQTKKRAGPSAGQKRRHMSARQSGLVEGKRESWMANMG